MNVRAGGDTGNPYSPIRGRVKKKKTALVRFKGKSARWGKELVPQSPSGKAGNKGSGEREPLKGERPNQGVWRQKTMGGNTLRTCLTRAQGRETGEKKGNQHWGGGDTTWFLGWTTQKGKEESDTSFVKSKKTRTQKKNLEKKASGGAVTRAKRGRKNAGSATKRLWEQDQKGNEAKKKGKTPTNEQKKKKKSIVCPGGGA